MFISLNTVDAFRLILPSERATLPTFEHALLCLDFESLDFIDLVSASLLRLRFKRADFRLSNTEGVIDF